MNNQSLREEFITFCRFGWERGFLAATDGNITCRIDDKRLLITPSGRSKARITTSDLLEVDLEGNVLKGNGRPSSEMAVHLAVYKARPDVNAVIHSHAPLATAITASGHDLDIRAIPEIIVGLGNVPTVPYATTGSKELAENVVPFLKDHDAMLLDHHGTLAYGPSLESAWARTEKLESAAHLYISALKLGGAKPLSPEERQTLRQKGGREDLSQDKKADILPLGQRIELKQLPFTADFLVEKHWQDTRGEAHLIVDDMPLKRVCLLTLKKDSGFRGGHYHKNKLEGFYVATGLAKVELFCLETKEKATYELGVGSRLMIPAMVAHRITAMEDLTFVEFCDSPYDAKDDLKFDFGE